MTLLLDLAIRSSIVLAAGLLFDVALRTRAAALRHFVLALSVAAAVAVVPLSTMMPDWRPAFLDSASGPVRQIADLRPAQAAAPLAAKPLQSAPHDAASGTPDPLPASLLLLAWIGGSAVTGLILLVAVVRLSRIAARGRPVQDAQWSALVRAIAADYGITRDVRLIHTASPDLLATWGFLRPSVLLPSHASEWSDDRRRVVLCHELAHIRRHDWLVQITAESLRSVLWFNPLIWITCTRLRRASEQACDDVVLGRGVSAGDYAAHLIDLARRCRRPRAATAMSMANPSTLERRIVAMLNPRLNRQAVTRRAAAAFAALLLAVTLPAAALRAGQGAPRILSGVLYDTSGAVLPGVKVELEDANQVKQSATTDSSGRFQFGAMAPGKYGLAAALPGFRALKQEIELRDAADWDRAITLPLGRLTETISVRSSRIQAPATATQPQGPARVRVGGNVRAPRKLQDVKPVYPESMRAAGRGGVVRLDAIINVDGTVSGANVLSADAHPDFAIAAIDAVRQWRFSPTLLNGQPVEVVMTVTIDFSIGN